MIAFFLEYDSDRAGDLKPIKTIWNNRDNVTIVLGLITSKKWQIRGSGYNRKTHHGSWPISTLG